MSESMIEMYKAGHSLAEVGEAHGGLSRERVRQILVANGENDRFFKQHKKDAWERKMYGDAVALIRERYIKGEYMRPVAKDVGVPWYIVEKLYKKTQEDIDAHERAKFFNKIKVGTKPEGFDTPCLEWTGTMDKGVSPIYCQNNNKRNAKQWHWWFTHGEWVTVERICPNTLCVALEHMRKVED